jgi:Raf kinase inhibitor-like YbhB/YbcL family protein
MRKNKADQENQIDRSGKKMGAIASPSPAPMRDAAFTLASPAFAEGEIIPVQYTCEGANQSPPLAWWGAPMGTRSFALIFDALDASKAEDGPVTHWMLFDIPVTTTRIAADASEARAGLPGSNDFGNVGYDGPFLLPGHGPHRYVFSLYALDTDMLHLGRGASRADLEAALKGHVLARAALDARYDTMDPAVSESAIGPRKIPQIREMPRKGSGMSSGEKPAMANCDTCGNYYDKTFEVVHQGRTHVFDCFECAIQALAPTCGHCGCRIIGHGVEADGTLFCCANCAREEAARGLRDRADEQERIAAETPALAG